VDADDASQALVERTAELTPAEAAEAMGMPHDAEPAAIAYVIAALREAFEETGLLLAVRDSGAAVPSAARDAALARMRDRLLVDDDLFAPLLAGHDLHLDGGAVAYLAHWITPVVEPRRYDARFFAAAVEGGSELLLNEAEMSAARWETPERALELHAAGELPMVFPTVKTLESLVGFTSPHEALAGLAERRVPSWLPRLVKTPEGVAMELDEV
jgi:8-oxo-dGTP pyrophosphatase MutT (NUDIX family)